MACGRLWQGIRDWLKRVPRGTSGFSSRDDSISRGEGALGSGSAARTWSPALGRIGSRSTSDLALDSSVSLASLTTGSVGEATFDVASDERELLDFLAADLDPVPADPVFRERLRGELWDMVVDGRFVRTKDS